MQIQETPYLETIVHFFTELKIAQYNIKKMLKGQSWDENLWFHSRDKNSSDRM